MATLTTSQRAELVVTDSGGATHVIVAGSVDFTGSAISLSPLYGHGQIDVIGIAEGSSVVTVVLGSLTGSLTVDVTVDEDGELVLTLGPIRPR